MHKSNEFRLLTAKWQVFQIQSVYNLTALENCVDGQTVCTKRMRAARETAMQYLQNVGRSSYPAKPHQLSGGSSSASHRGRCPWA
jgi:ABC-type polar amino acid transport system ATPase subunit